MKKFKVKSTMTVSDLNGQFESDYRVLTPKGNVAGDDRKLRALTDMDISKELEFELELKADDFIEKFKEKTGITVERSIDDFWETGNVDNDVDYDEDNVIPEGKEEVTVCISYEGGESDCLGCEITIGALDTNDVNTLMKALDEDNIFDSEIFNNWMDYDSIYHNQGVVIPCQAEDYVDIGDFKDCESLSTDNWEFDEEFADSEKGINLINIPKKGIFIITVRNEDVYWIAKGVRDESGTKSKVQVFVDKIMPLGDIWSELGVVKDTQINGESLERDIDLETDYYSNIYQINQFIVKDEKIIAWFSSSDDPGMQWETSLDELDRSSVMYIDVDSFDPEDDEYLEQKEELLNKLRN